MQAEQYPQGLEHEEVLRLLKRSQAGDEEAKERIYLCNIALVRSVVKRFLSHDYEYDDLFQLGCMGLVKAINNYDESYGVRFSTYAVPLIMGEIRRFLRDDGMIRVSRPVKALYAKVMNARQELYEVYSREPTIQELAQHLQAQPEEINAAMEAARMPLSLHSPLQEKNGSKELTIGDSIGEEDQTAEIIDRVMLKEILTELPVRERKLIVMRYLMEKTQTEVAKSMGISQVQVSRMEAKIILKMRNRIKEDEEVQLKMPVK